LIPSEAVVIDSTDTNDAMIKLVSDVSWKMTPNIEIGT